jgi:hypothetical protein
MIKDVHLASKDIAVLYEKENSIPKFITYPCFFIILFIVLILGRIKK